MPCFVNPSKRVGRGAARSGGSALFWAFACAAVFVAGGCVVGPDYRRPDVRAPAAYRENGGDSAGDIADLPWWGVFNDPALQDLIRASLTNSYDLRVVLSRVDQARALQMQSQSQFLPEMDYGGLTSRGQNSFLTMPALNGGRTLTGIIGGAQAVWEIDLWGRVSRMNEAVRAQYMASQEGRRAVMVSLVGKVACAYFELLELDDQLAIAKRTQASYERTLRLFEDQHANGLASKLELSRAKAALHAVSARIPDGERQIALKENALCVLTGSNPGPVARSSLSQKQTGSVDIPVGLPSSLLERRPDIRMAEARVRAANAEIGAALGDFFPRVGLTAFFGATSTELDQLKSDRARTWTLAAGATGPLFTGGRLTGRYRMAKAACEEEKLQYQAAALTAFREVADALVSRKKIEEARALQAEAVDACRDAVQVATERYENGKASYYEVLEAQQQLYPAETALSHLEAGRLQALVQLYTALGGGWSLDDGEGGGAKPRECGNVPSR